MGVVNILGREYKIRTGRDESHLQRAGLYLDEVLKEIQRTTPDTHDALVLAALNLASEMVRLRDARSDELQRLRGLIEQVESI